MHPPAPAAATVADPPPASYVVCLAGEFDEEEMVEEIGLAGLTWLRETGLVTYPSSPPPVSAHIAALPTLAADGEPSLTRPVLCLAGEVDENELVEEIGLAGLNWLRGKALLTYPSPLLGGLLEKQSDVLTEEVLPLLQPADLAVLAQVGVPWLVAAVASGLSRAGKTAGVPLKVEEFVVSVERLAWAKANGCPWISRTCSLAAKDGHLAVLQWARAHDCLWETFELDRLPNCSRTTGTCERATEGGHLAVLQWARENGCPWTEFNVNARAAAGGHLAVLQWLLENDCPWLEDLEYDDDEDCCALAALGGHLETLKWLRGHGCPWDETTFMCAAEGGCLEVVQWLWHEHDCPWDEWACAQAAWAGHLDVLQWLWEHGCPWMPMDEETCSNAAWCGHLDLLKWARQHNCPWNEETCALAAQGGKLDVLKWAREHHCPWNEMTCAWAAYGGHIDVLKWAREHHCPWDRLTRHHAQQYGGLKVLMWAIEHGAP